MLHEVKKSRKIEEAGILQVKYYLYYLKKKGVTGIRARIDYPLLKQSLDLELTEDDEREIEAVLEDIPTISESKVPEKAEKRVSVNPVPIMTCVLFKGKQTWENGVKYEKKLLHL